MLFFCRNYLILINFTLINNYIIYKVLGQNIHNMNTLDKLLFNLEIIASIPSGKRIVTNKEFIDIDADSAFQGVWRWKSGDGRDRAVQIICKEIRTAILIAGCMRESYYFMDLDFNDEQWVIRTCRIIDLKKIRFGLVRAIYGVSSLCTTYSEDPNTLANLRLLPVEITSCTTLIVQTLESIGEIVDTIGDSHSPLINYMH